jgi:hypothetical protein
MDGFPQESRPGQAVVLRTQYERKLQQFLDASVPHTAARWAVFSAVVVLYTVRVMLLKGFYIVTYGIGIFNLNLVIGFLTPAFDPDQDAPTLPTTEQEFKPFVRRVPEFKFWCAARRGPGAQYGAARGGGLGAQASQCGRPASRLHELHSWRPWLSGAPSRLCTALTPSPSGCRAPSVLSLRRLNSIKSFLVGFLMTFFPMFDIPVFWPILLMYWLMLFVLTMKRQIKHMIKHRYLPFTHGKQRYGGGQGGRTPAKDSK